MIDWFVRAFLKSSLVWLSLAVALAVAMAVVPSAAVYRTAHLHMALLGFVAQMIYGVALHVIPRFFGQPLVFPRLGGVQFWSAQAGLALMASGFALRVHGIPIAQVMLASGGLLSATAAGCFVLNLWRTMDAATMREIHERAKAHPSRVMPSAKS
jgi:cbb3-type cytochrome oxidase subunit 1